MGKLCFAISKTEDLISTVVVFLSDCKKEPDQMTLN
jgi:hypothetical protein